MTRPRLADVKVPVLDALKWEQLRTLAQADHTFAPVEVKAGYVIGLIDDICQSVQCLVKAEKAWPEKYLPAFGVFASAVDLFGRCLTGNRTLCVNENLRVGFWYLFHPSNIPPPKALSSDKAAAVLVTTSISYAVDDLVALRHYSSHGQAASKDLPSIDNQLLAQFPRPLGDAIETYWSALLNDAEYCRRLGDALIDPYANRAEPLKKTLACFQAGCAAGDLFYGLDWQV